MLVYLYILKLQVWGDIFFQVFFISFDEKYLYYFSTMQEFLPTSMVARFKSFFLRNQMHQSSLTVWILGRLKTPITYPINQCLLFK